MEEKKGPNLLLCHCLWEIVDDQVGLPVPLVHVGLGGYVHPGPSQHIGHSILHHLDF